MGKFRRFRLSDMMPNAWFYKLRDFGATAHKKTPNKPKLSHLPTSATPYHSKPDHQTQQQHYSYSRKSYHFTRDLNPRDDINSSTAQRSKRRTSTTTATARSSPKFVSSSSSSVPNWPKPDSPSGSLSDSDSFSPEFRSDCSLTTESFDKKVSWSSNSCGCPLELVDSSSASSDIIIDVDKHSLPTKKQALQVFDHLPALHLPPILTKGQSTKKQSTGRKHYYGGGNNSPGIKLRANSPRIGCQYRRKNQLQGGRKSVSSERSSSLSSSSRRRMSKTVSSGCLAVVKSSYDPQRDFRESMVEMIVEKNISASKDLEDLLACYLSLNSDEYHDVIIKVFKQIWFDHLITTSK